jgi:hypothetical protein
MLFVSRATQQRLLPPQQLEHCALQRLNVLHRTQLLHALGRDLLRQLEQRFAPPFKSAFISTFKSAFKPTFISTFKLTFKSAFKPTLHPSLTPQTLSDGFLFYWRC